jgi:ABC-type bacteriocin/lantibiotic exporter with double-glycine peptidase domain
MFSIILDYHISKMQDKLTARIGSQFESKITNQLFQAIITPQLDKFKKLEIGEYLERIDLIPQLKSFFSGDLISSVINIFTCLVTLLIITLIDFKTGMILVVASFFLYILAHFISKKERGLLTRKAKIEGISNSKVIEIISFPHDIKTRAMEFRIENLMNNIISLREQYSTEYAKQQSSYSLILNLVQQISVTFVVVSSAIAVIDTEMSQGVMAAIIMLTNRYFGPYQQAMRTIGQWKTNQIYISQLNDILAIKKEIITTKKSEDNHLPRFKINNQSIEFLSDKINLLQGHTGSGKTTLFNYLMYGNDPLITPIQHDIVCVNKNSSFIEGSIIDNITCFRPQLHKAAYLLCEALNIKDELDKLRLGFSTEISRKSSNIFSRQISFSLLLVRALLSDKHIILIDDFDLVYEADFVVNLLACMYPRTHTYTFIIATNKIDQHSTKTNTIIMNSNKGSK